MNVDIVDGEILTRVEYDAATRSDLKTFVERVFAELHPGKRFYDNWHIDLMCAELMALERGEKTGIIFNLPPRYLKSLIVSVALPAWVLGRDPTKELIAGTHGQQLADEFGRDSLQVMNAPWYQHAFPRTRIARGRSAPSDFRTTLGGGRLAISRGGGSATGRGADYLLIDDPLKLEERTSTAALDESFAWVTALLLRDNLSSPLRTVVAHQRLHEDDVTGRLVDLGGFEIIYALAAIAEWEEAYTFETAFGTQTILRQPGDVLHPQRQSRERLAERREQSSEEDFRAVYQQDPMPAAERKIFRLFDFAPGEEGDDVFDTHVLIDTTFLAADGTRCVVVIYLAGSHMGRCVLGAWCWRLDDRQLTKRLMALVAEIAPTTVLVDDSRSNKKLVASLRHQGHHVVGWKPRGERSPGARRTRLVDGVLVPYGFGRIEGLNRYLSLVAPLPKGLPYEDDLTIKAVKYFGRDANGSEYFMAEAMRLIMDGGP